MIGSCCARAYATCAALVHDVRPAAEILRELVEGAEAALASVVIR